MRLNRILLVLPLVTTALPGMAVSQALPRPLVLNQRQYRAVAGERVRLEAAPETLRFMRSAENRLARAESRSFPVAPDSANGQILLGIPLTTQPGDYAISLSFTTGSGERRTTTVQLAVEPFVVPAANSSVPPMVLLDGWQPSNATSSCPMSSDSTGTFGNLASYLQGAPNLVPAVYFFENCTECPSCAIEQLGADLGQFLNSLHYADGTPVPQVDVIAHSMGGLIVRSYLSGKQPTSGLFSPPATPKIRKAVFLATPHFGSYQADTALAQSLFGTGVQTSAMKRGSQFLWDLATWNQFGDDLRGIDAVSAIGNAGTYPSGNLAQAADGLVALTSGSLDFAMPGRTRVVSYCHVPLPPGLEAAFLGCTGPGIANIDSPSHQSYQIISSFLLNTLDWQNVGSAPAQDPVLSKNGGILVTDLDNNGQSISTPNATWGSVSLGTGPTGNLYFSDFVSGKGSFAFGSSTCGPYTAPNGFYATVRCKTSPSITSIGPLLAGAAKTVQAGAAITITGSGFGAQQCAACRVTAANPQVAPLQIASWSDTNIGASLPASYPGELTLTVTTANGADSINLMTASQAPSNTPVITGVSNAAGGQPGVFPGSFISIYGTNLTPVSDTWSNAIHNGQLPNQLDGVTVTIGGKPAYIAQMIPNQINAQAPEVPPGPVQVTVITPAGTSAPFTVNAQTYAPAFWPWPGNQPVATHADYTLAAKAGSIPGAVTRPAAPGEVITLWGTGFGPTNPAVPAGQLPTVQASATQAPVTITLNGANVTVIGAVLSSYPGDYQIAIQVPASLSSGDYQLLATIGGASSPAVTLTVQP